MSPRNEKKRRKSRKKKDADPEWKPDKAKRKYSKNKQHTGLLHARADTKKTVEIDGKRTALKTAVMVDVSRIHFKEDETNRHRILQSSTNNGTPATSNRPIKKVTFSIKNSPLAVETLFGTKLPRTGSYGTMHFFDNREQNTTPITQQSMVTVLDDNHPFFKSKQYNNIKQFHRHCKEQFMQITSSILEKSYRERAENNFKRTVPQNKVMSKRGRAKEGSATLYAQEAIAIKNMQWEHLHLLAYFLVNAEGQTVDNMIVGTHYANTDMMFVEDELTKLANHYPDGFTLKVSAKLVKKNSDEKDQEHLQIGTIIEYTIATKDFEVPFEFNAQNARQPHISNKKYIEEFFKTLLAACEANSPASKSDNEVKRSLNFFDRSNLEEQAPTPVKKSKKMPPSLK